MRPEWRTRPGSREALEDGCLCPAQTDRHEGSELWVVSDRCPGHGSAQPQEHRHEQPGDFRWPDWAQRVQITGPDVQWGLDVNMSEPRVTGRLAARTLRRLNDLVRVIDEWAAYTRAEMEKKSRWGSG